MTAQSSPSLVPPAIGSGEHEVDVAVVGAGVTGLSVAWHLRKKGAEVLVLERRGIAAGASGVQPGGVRQQWSTAVNCRLARESTGFYRRARDLLGGPAELRFAPCGYMFVAHSASTLERLRANVGIQTAAGVPSRIVDPVEAGRLVPGLATAGLAGASWCEEDGYVDQPRAVVAAFAREARIEIGEVVALQHDREGWRLALGSGRWVRAKTAVVAAGVDTPALLQPLGFVLPIEPEERWIFLSAPIRERLVEPLVVSPELHFAAKQLADGRVLASDLSATGPSDSAAAQWRRTIRLATAELLPILEHVHFTLLVQGVYDVTPDRQAIIGRVPGTDGLWVAAGFSGHGFMLAPAVGRILADAIAGTAEDEALAMLDPGRFAEGRLVPEQQVV